MNAIARKGWCPSLFEPMESGDGWLTRVKPPRGVLTSEAARALAAAVARHGNGTIELTSRANLQIRGLAPDGVAPFAEAVVSAGLAELHPATERRRAVIHPPLAEATFTLATEVEAILAGDPALALLPAKFCVAVDDGGPLPLGQTSADLTATHLRRDVLILPAGSNLGVRVAPPHAAEAVRRLALGFLVVARQAALAPRRMRSLIDLVGAAPLFTAADLGPGLPAETPSAAETVGWLLCANGPEYGHGVGVVGLGAPFGVMDAATLTSLADLAERYGRAEIRVTPWRTVLFPRVAASDRNAVQTAARALGMIVDPADRRRAIVTCTGQPGCAAASVDVRADAAMLRHLDLPAPVHVSGCAKGCAHPGAAPLTLIGEGGRYNVVLGGDTHAHPSVRGRTMQQVVNALKQQQIAGVSGEGRVAERPATMLDHRR